MKNTKFVVNTQEPDFRMGAVAVFDTYEGAVNAVLDALKPRIEDWDVIHTDNTIEKDTGKVCLFFHRRRNEYRIYIAELAHNTLKDDPVEICQDHIREWMRL